MNWETVNPLWWVPRGYASVRVDGRGSGKSPGQCEPWSRAEAVDFHDAIEWAAAQPWCNGNVGLSGISYYAINQWFAANHQPPSLKAIIPWEGFADIYRDALFHGGILCLFMTNWYTAHCCITCSAVRRSRFRTPGRTNTLQFWSSNNLDSGAFHGAQAEWDKITVPLSRSATGRASGCICAATPKASCARRSKHKKLRIQAGTHVHPFYTDEGTADQLRFFDHWLKGTDNGIMDEPPIKLAIRNGAMTSNGGYENEWPLARTKWTKLYFDLSSTSTDGPAGQDASTSTNPAKTLPAPMRRLVGTMGSTSAASSQVMGGGIKPGMGVALETPPLRTTSR